MEENKKYVGGVWKSDTALNHDAITALAQNTNRMLDKTHFLLFNAFFFSFFFYSHNKPLLLYVLIYILSVIQSCTLKPKLPFQRFSNLSIPESDERFIFIKTFSTRIIDKKKKAPHLVFKMKLCTIFAYFVCTDSPITNHMQDKASSRLRKRPILLLCCETAWNGIAIFSY